jgi:hypothetical protein
MIRWAIESIILFFLPTLIYVGYVWLRRPDEMTGRDVLAEAPILWLTATGAILVVLVMIVFGSIEGGKPGEGYEPPVYKDGKIIPGHKQ